MLIYFVFKVFLCSIARGKKLNMILYFRNTHIFDMLICLVHLKEEINFKCFPNFFDFDALYCYLMRLLPIQLNTHQETPDCVLHKAP